MNLIDWLLIGYTKKTLEDMKDRKKIYLFIGRKGLIVWFILILLLWFTLILKNKEIISSGLMWGFHIFLVLLRFYLVSLSRKKMKEYGIKP